MATTYSDLYNAQKGLVANAAKQEIGDVNGRIRFMHFYKALESNVVAISDVVKLGVLPKGARVVDGVINSVSLGTTGIFNWGWSASTDGVETASTAGFATGVDAGGQVASGTIRPAGTTRPVGFMKKFAADVDVQLIFTEATDAALGDVIEGYIAYVID